MYYQKQLNPPKTETQTIKLDQFAKGMKNDVSEDLNPVSQGVSCYNYNYKAGALKTCAGFSNLYLPVAKDSAITRRVRPCEDELSASLIHFRYYNTYTGVASNKIVFINGNGHICYNAVFGYDVRPVELDTITFSTMPRPVQHRINGNDCIVFCSSADYAVIFDYQNICVTLSSLPRIIDFCVKYDNIFAILGGARNTIAYSNEMDFSEWNSTFTDDGEGLIEIPDTYGKLCRILAFDDYIYVFGEYAIGKISAYGSSGEYSLTHLFKTNSRIYGDTITICNEQIMFLSQDGLYSFDGQTAKKIYLGIEQNFDSVYNRYATGEFHKGKFFLALKMDFADSNQIVCESCVTGYKNNALLIYDITSKELQIIRGIDIYDMLSIDESEVNKLMFCFNNENQYEFAELNEVGKIFGTYLPKLWQSPNSDFDCPLEQKTLKEISLISKNDCQITITNQQETKVFAVEGKETLQKIKANVKGEHLQITISSAQDADISCVNLKYSVTK